MTCPVGVHCEQPPTAARGKPSRWLLIVLILAALGIWHGAHCADDMAGHAADTGVAGVHVHGLPAHPAASAANQLLGDLAVSVTPDLPGSATAQCHPLVSTFTGTTAASVSTAPQLAMQVRVAPDDLPRPVQPVPSGVTLTALGISRT
jgi:hypothetical protein